MSADRQLTTIESLREFSRGFVLVGLLTYDIVLAVPSLFINYVWIRVMDNGSLSLASDDAQQEHRRHVTPSSLERCVKREMNRVQTTLQLVASPANTLVDTFCACLPNASPTELQQVMDMQGLSKARQKVALEELHQRRTSVT